MVDTIGLNDKTFIDNYRTPHSEKLHVVERYKLVDGGKTLQVTFRVEDPDTFYHADLVGLDVVSVEGAQIGTVHAVHNFGAGDILEIMPLGRGAPVMLPFTDATVPKVDLSARQIVIVPPAEIEAKKDD